MKSIFKKINNIKKMEDKVKNSQKNYYLNKKSKEQLDTELKKLHDEYINLEKIINQELNNK